MIGIVFLLLIYIGVYLLLRSRYESLSIGKYMAVIVGVLVIGIALSFGRLPNRPIVDRVIHAVDVINMDDIQVIELNADDLDPQIQEALLTAARRRVRRRQLTTADILNVLEKSTAPQDGTCGVCYDGLDNGELLACPECHKIAHRDCLETWIESGQNVCIYCRHDLIPA